MIIPTGLALRPEFRTQHDEGKEASPGDGKTNAPPARPETQQPDPGKPAATGQQDCWGMLPMIVLMVVVFYFFLIRPQQKQEKTLKAMRSVLKKGDRVVTSGGMHAVVNSVETNAVTLRPTADGPLMVFDASAIARVISDEAKAEGGKGDVKKIDNGTADGGRKS